MREDELVFFFILFALENLVFAGIGIGAVVASWVRWLERRRERKMTEKPTLAVEEYRQDELRALRDDMNSVKEMMADLLLELDRQRRSSSGAESDEKVIPRRSE